MNRARPAPKRRATDRATNPDRPEEFEAHWSTDHPDHAQAVRDLDTVAMGCVGLVALVFALATIGTAVVAMLIGWLA
jgi:hypothetical protein